MRKFAMALIGIVILAGLAYGAVFWTLRNPHFRVTPVARDISADPTRLANHVSFLAGLEPGRAFHNPAKLDEAANYIENEFAQNGCKPERQSFEIDGNAYHNIICSFGPSSAPRLIFGAHYDVAGDNNPGADDNASGVAGLMELARMLASQKPDLANRVDLVAYTLEEPPNFRSQQMGSYHFAASLKENDIPIRLSISIEMIGYFSDEENSQKFPLSLLKLFYPGKGNFIAVVGRLFDRSNVADVKSLIGSASQLPVYSINAPEIVPGVDFSDHWSFWQLGLPAIMVTDTAFLRNPNYHRASDTPDTLDYRRMGEVVDGLYAVAIGLKP